MFCSVNELLLSSAAEAPDGSAIVSTVNEADIVADM
jgi:hypothetical protein